MQAITAFIFFSEVPRVGPAGLPRGGWGRGLWPRPAERRWLSCRLIESFNVWMQPLFLNIVELMMLKHLGRHPSIIACELFGYSSHSGLSQHVQGKRAELHKLFPADAGLGGAPRPGVGPRYPSASHRAGPRRSGGNYFCAWMRDMLMSLCRCRQGQLSSPLQDLVLWLHQCVLILYIFQSSPPIQLQATFWLSPSLLDQEPCEIDNLLMEIRRKLFDYFFQIRH